MSSDRRRMGRGLVYGLWSLVKNPRSYPIVNILKRHRGTEAQREMKKLGTDIQRKMKKTLCL